MMRRVTENEIYDLNNNRISDEEFLSSISYACSKKNMVIREILSLFHHVDTREQDKCRCNDCKVYRLQGYFEWEDFEKLKSLCNEFDYHVFALDGVKFTDKIEVWYTDLMTFPHV